MAWKNGATQVPQAADKASYPFIQWVNNGTTLDPREPRGGFAMPEEQMLLVNDYPADGVMHELYLKQGGNPISVAYNETLKAAVLATRFAWVLEGNFIPEYVSGARSKMQALCLVLGSEKPMLVMLTFAGMTGKSFSEAWKKHKERVQKATVKAGQKAPASIFYAVYAAGTPCLEGQGDKQSWVTPVVLSDAEAEIDLDAAYVGDDALALIDWSAVEEWRKAWDNPKGPNGEGELSETAEGTAKARPQQSAAPTPVATPVRPATTGAYSASLPFRSDKYPNGTVQNLFDARDEAALKGTLDWCKKKGMQETPACRQAEAALNALQMPVAPAPVPAPEMDDDIPF